MKIIECMKELKLIINKMTDNYERMAEYAAYVSTEVPPFGDEDTQTKKMSSLIQANEDHLERYLDLKAQLERTNLETMVTIDGVTRSISQWLVYLRKLEYHHRLTYQALNTETADRKLRNADQNRAPQVIRCYNEEDKVNALRKIMETVSKIESTLEVVNATTNIV